MSLSSEPTVCSEKTSYMTDQYSENNNDIKININDNNDDYENITMIKLGLMFSVSVTYRLIMYFLIIVGIYAYLA
jgi:hypothetical protein